MSEQLRKLKHIRAGYKSVITKYLLKLGKDEGKKSPEQLLNSTRDIKRKIESLNDNILSVISDEAEISKEIEDA